MPETDPNTEFYQVLVYFKLWGPIKVADRQTFNYNYPCKIPS